MKRNEICNQIESWIAELSKPHQSERSGRTISFNSMVLRRQYKQLREELAKLPTPEGLEDLDVPFNSNVTSPSTSNNNINANFSNSNTNSTSQQLLSSESDEALGFFDTSLSDSNNTSNILDTSDSLGLTIDEIV